MKRALPFVLLLVLPTTPVEAAEPKPCAAKGSVTVERNSVARVFKKGRPGFETLTGCLYRRDSRRKLATNYTDDLYETDTWADVALWRRFVTWTFTQTDVSCKAECPPGYGYSKTTFVRDLASGKRRALPGDMVLGRSFVITDTKVIATVRKGELRTWNGEVQAVLDTGVDGATLEAHGDRVAWVKDGQRKVQALS